MHTHHYHKCIVWDCKLWRRILATVVVWYFISTLSQHQKLTYKNSFLVLTWGIKDYKIAFACGSVGIGRRARLRILWWLHREGSSPFFRTKEYREIDTLFVFVQFSFAEIFLISGGFVNILQRIIVILGICKATTNAGSLKNDQFPFQKIIVLWWYLLWNLLSPVL